MKESTLNRMIREHKERFIWAAVFVILAVFVTALVFGTLKRSVQAQTYTKRVFTCPAAEEGAEPVAHQHNDDCYENGELICTLPERELHIHGDECYAEEKVLICTLEEGEGHVHTDACYKEEPVLVCGLEEDPGHTHTDECYSEEQVLVCGQEENDGHVHSAENGCYTRVQGDLICTNEDPEHVHNDDCYAWEELLTCEIPEGEGAHHHSEECYETQRVLSCGQEEREPGHMHSEECYETQRVLSCGKEAGEGAHTHDETCYEIQKVLICDKEEVKNEHVHTAECFQVVDMTPEEIHALHLSELPESDPEADVESPDVWESRFASVPLSGEWDRDLLKIAETQLGYTESQRNFEAVPDEYGDGYTLKGWTRYGAWYGIPYGDWCAMFISFCLNYADIPESAVPYDCATTTWIDSLSSRGMYAPAGSYDPKPGDLIFFDWEGDGLSDHVGIVWAVNSGSITAIEGNHTISVELFDYDLYDGHIQGYGILPENPELAAAEENAEPVDTADTENIDNNKEEAEEATEDADTEPSENGAEASDPMTDVSATEASEPVTDVPAAEAETGVSMPEFHHSERVAGMRVTIDADEGAFPEGTTVEIKAIEDDGLAEQVAPAVTSGRVVAIQAVDITFYDADGNEIEPRIPIHVTMRPFTETVEANNIEVVHVDNDGAVSAVTTDDSIQQPDKGAAFNADSFSKYVLVYTADFEYEVNGNIYTFSVPGAQDTALSAILRALNIVDEAEISEFLSKIKDVSVTNSDVLKLTAVEGDWTVRPIRDSENQESLSINMKDGAAFSVSFEVHGITEVVAENENAVIAAVNDLYLPADAVAYAEVLPRLEREAAVSVVKESADASSFFTIDETSYEKTAYQVFDIGLENVDVNEYNDGFKVEIRVDEEMNLEGKDFRIYQIQNGNAVDLTDSLELTTAQSENGLQNLSSFSFTTDDFANFVLSYTIETQYTAFDGSTFKVTMNYGSDAGLPDGSELKVREILPDDDEFAQYYSEAMRAAGGSESSDEPAEDGYARFFDIEIWADDQKVEPKAVVSVKIELEDAPLTDLKVVHFDENGPVVLESEKETSKDISFETDSFSIYAILSTSGNLSDLRNLDGRSFTISRDNGQFMTAKVINRQFNKSTDQTAAATWVFENNGNANEGWGQYSIFTYIDGEKKYMNLVSDNQGDSQAWAVLNDNPQQFNIHKDGNKFYIEAWSNGKQYFLNEFAGSGTGFAGWQDRNNRDDLFNINLFTPTTAQRETSTYAVIVKNPEDGKYYAVQHDGSLVEVTYSVENNTAGVFLINPQLWTYTGAHDGLSDQDHDPKLKMTDGDVHSNWEPYNLRAAADARAFGSNQLPDTYYYRYISPQESLGIYEESPSNPIHGSGDGHDYNAYTTGAKWYSGLRYENNTLYGIHYDPANSDGTWNISNGKYIGADFENLHITGQNDANHAATVFLAKVQNTQTVGANNETVSHIDIGIFGDAELEIPLAYGKYYDQERNLILDTSEGIDVTLDLTKDVQINKEDMMAATITARDKKGSILDDAFYITGYSANEHTSASAVQVRMEGSFKVTTLDPYTGGDSNSDANRLLARKENQVYYQVTTTKEITFDWIWTDGDGIEHQLCDESGKPLTITVPMNFSINFSYWDEANECPPILPYPHYFEVDYFNDPKTAGKNYNLWTRGGIIDGREEYHWADSGMDFVIGAKDALENQSVAVEIIKVIEDESGNVIHPSSSVSNSFNIYGKSDYNQTDLSDIHNLAVTRNNAVSSSSLNYTGYQRTDTRTISVGESGYGVTYDYVDPGMYYVTEDDSSMQNGGPNKVITDQDGTVWGYVSTRVETEYVWRDNEYNDKRHVANGYSGVPEVLGEYVTDKGVTQQNKFLQFYVYNVYKRIGSLKLQKLVEVEGSAPNSEWELIPGNGEDSWWNLVNQGNASYVDGAYDFSITGPIGSYSPTTKYVRIIIRGGRMDNYDVKDSREALGTFDLNDDYDWWGGYGEEVDRWVLVEGLAAGDYEITEIGAYKCEYHNNDLAYPYGIYATTPLENVSLIRVSGGKNDANLSEHKITVTVVAGDVNAEAPSAQATFVNGTAFVSIPFKAKKTFEQDLLTENQFQFNLLEYQSASFDSVKTGGINQTVSNSAPAAGNNNADVIFNDVRITAPGAYYYIISETASNDGTGILYDTHQQKVIVTVTADNEGRLSYSKAYDPQFTEEDYDAAFVNKRVSLSLKKIAEASQNTPVDGIITYTDGDYSFTVTDENGDSRTVVITLINGEMTSAKFNDGTPIDGQGADIAFDAENGVTFFSLTPGHYTITEDDFSPAENITLPENTGMYLKSIEVTPGEGNSFNKADKQAIVTISEGEGRDSASVAVTFTNIVEPDIPTVDKTVADYNDSIYEGVDYSSSEYYWRYSADYDVGDLVPFRITVNMPSEAYRSSNSYELTISDTMENMTYAEGSGRMYAFVKSDTDELGTWYDVTRCIEVVPAADLKSFSISTDVKNNKSNLKVSDWNGPGNNTHSNYYPLNDPDVAEEGEDFNPDDIRMLQFRYKARLTEDAEIGPNGNDNTVTLTYPSGTATSLNRVFTYRLVVNKKNESGEPLNGAEFQLYKKYKNNALITDSTIASMPVANRYGDGEMEIRIHAGTGLPETLDLSRLNNSVSGDFYLVGERVGENASEFSWNGIDDGTYILIETKAPAEYNLLADPIALSIEVNHQDNKEEGQNADPSIQSGYLNVYPEEYRSSYFGSTINGDIPSNGTISANIPNSKGKFRVSKEWLDILDSDLQYYPEVYFTLYRKTELTNSNNPPEVVQPFVDVPLNYRNSWTWDCPVDLPANDGKGHTYDYFVVETPKEEQKPGAFSDIIKTEPNYDLIKDGSLDVVIKVDGYKSRDTVGSGPWKQSTPALPTQPDYAAIGNEGEIQIQNKTLKYMQMDIKKKFLRYVENATHNGYELQTQTSDPRTMHDLVIEVELWRRILKPESSLDPDLQSGNILKDWEKYGESIMVGYGHTDDGSEGSPICVNTNPFQIDYQSAWHWRIICTGQNQGLPAYGIYDGQRVRYQYTLKEVNAYKNTDKESLGYDWTSILPVAWDGGGDTASPPQVELFPKIVAQDQDRLVNLQDTNLKITKAWVMGGTNVQEVYVKVYRGTGINSNLSNSDDFTKDLYPLSQRLTDLRNGDFDNGYVSEGSIITRQEDGEKYLVIPSGGTMTIEYVPILNPYNGSQDCLYHYGVVECGYKDKTSGAVHWEDDIAQFHPQYSFENPIAQNYSQNMFVLGKKGENEFVITNTAVSVDIGIEKVDADHTDKKLVGAKFSLYKFNDTAFEIVEAIDNVNLDENHFFTISSEDGKITLAGLGAGRYEIREEVPPAGYLITVKTPVTFEVKADGTIDPGSDLGTVTYDTASKTFKVPNTPGAELPKTGGPRTVLFELIGGVLAGTAGAALTLRKKKK